MPSLHRIARFARAGVPRRRSPDSRPEIERAGSFECTRSSSPAASSIESSREAAYAWSGLRPRRGRAGGVRPGAARGRRQRGGHRYHRALPAARCPPPSSPTGARARSRSSSSSGARGYMRKQGHRQAYTEVRITGRIGGLSSGRGGHPDGAQEGRRQQPERPRFPTPSASASSASGESGKGGEHHRAPARYALSCRRERRVRPGSHSVRNRRRAGGCSMRAAPRNRRYVSVRPALNAAFPRAARLPSRPRRAPRPRTGSSPG